MKKLLLLVFDILGSEDRIEPGVERLVIIESGAGH
jgi:hypothetical protein